MAFTQPCFIRKNSPILIEYLKKLGYTVPLSGSILKKGTGIFVQPPNWYGSFKGEPNWDYEELEDCGTNEELFKAIAALNDETDYMQWFVKDGVWFLCDRDDWDDCVSDLTVGTKFSSNEQRGEWLDHLESFHKATVEELIEHFK